MGFHFSGSKAPTPPKRLRDLVPGDTFYFASDIGKANYQRVDGGQIVRLISGATQTLQTNESMFHAPVIRTKLTVIVKELD